MTFDSFGQFVNSSTPVTSPDPSSSIISNSPKSALPDFVETVNSISLAALNQPLASPISLTTDRLTSTTQSKPEEDQKLTVAQASPKEKELETELKTSFTQFLKNVTDLNYMLELYKGKIKSISVENIYEKVYMLLLDCIKRLVAPKQEANTLSRELFKASIEMRRIQSKHDLYKKLFYQSFRELLAASPKLCHLMLEETKSALVQDKLNSPLCYEFYILHALIRKFGDPSGLDFLISSAMIDSYKNIEKIALKDSSLFQEKGLGGFTAFDIAVLRGREEICTLILNNKGISSDPYRILPYVKNAKIRSLFQRHNLCSEELLDFGTNARMHMALLTPNPIQHRNSNKSINDYYPNLQPEVRVIYATAIDHILNKGHKPWNSDILAKEETRIKLDSNPASYYNASIVGKKFVVGATPRDSEFGTFWSLIAEKKVKLLVNLTDAGIGESSLDATPVYWPKKGTELANPSRTICVSLKHETTYPNCVMRQFNIKNGSEIIHVVTQVQYPVMDGYPMDTSDMLELYEFYKNVNGQKDANGQVVIHCVGGAGRSGTAACTLEALDQLSMNQDVDIVKIVNQFRKDRDGLVQTQEQFYSIKIACEAYKKRSPNHPDDKKAATR